MLKCKDVTHLLSESQDRRLKLAERVQLKMHLAVCQGCTRYQQQLNFIRRACRAFAGGDSGPDDPA